MGTAAIGFLIGLAIAAVLELVASFLLSCSIMIAQMLLKANAIAFGGSNFFAVISNLIPNIGFDVGTVINAFAYGILLVNIGIVAIRTIAIPLTGENTESPWKVLFDTFLAVILIYFTFGSASGVSASGFSPAIQNGSLLKILGDLFTTILAPLQANIASLSPWDSIKFGTTLNPPVLLFLVMITLGLMTTTIQAAITHIERFVSFAIYILFGPICIAMYPNKETRQITKEWFLGIIAQFLTIFISSIMWIAYLKKLSDIPLATQTWGEVEGMAIDLVIATALLGLVKNSEKILNSFGLKTMMSGDSARTFLTGMGTLGAGVMMGMRTAQMARGFSRDAKAAKANRDRMPANQNVNANSSAKPATNSGSADKRYIPGDSGPGKKQQGAGYVPTGNEPSLVPPGGTPTPMQLRHGAIDPSQRASAGGYRYNSENTIPSPGGNNSTLVPQTSEIQQSSNASPQQNANATKYNVGVQAVNSFNDKVPATQVVGTIGGGISPMNNTYGIASHLSTTGEKYEGKNLGGYTFVDQDGKYVTAVPNEALSSLEHGTEVKAFDNSTLGTLDIDNAFTHEGTTYIPLENNPSLLNSETHSSEGSEYADLMFNMDESEINNPDNIAFNELFDETIL